MRHSEGLAALAVTLVVVWFHLVRLGHAGGLWRDEVQVVNLAGRSSLAEMAKDSFPVLLPLVVHAWSAVGLGKSDLGFRALGLLTGLGLIGSLWVSARVTTRSAPLLGLALFGVNTTVITYGDSLRAYGLGSLFLVMAAATIWVCLKQPTASRAVWAGCFAVLSVQTLYQNAVLIGAICIGAWTVCFWRRAWRAAAYIAFIAGGMAVSLTVYVPVLVAGRDSAVVLRAGSQFPDAVANLKDALGFPLNSYSWVWGLLCLALVLLAAAGLRRKDQLSATAPHQVTGEDCRLFAGATLAAGIVGFAAFHWFAGFAAKPWYFLPIMALAALCFDSGLRPLPRWLQLGLPSLVLATAIIAIPFARQDLTWRFTDVDLLARRLTVEASPGDFVIVFPWHCGLTFERYFKGTTPWSTLPPLTDHSTHRYDLVHAQLHASHPIKPVLERIMATLQKGNRVWVVGQMDIPSPGTPAPRDLPPVPLDSTRLPQRRYLEAWIDQVAYLLSEHSSKLDLLAHSAPNQVNPNEDLDLFVASGWGAERKSDPPSKQPGR